MIKDRLLILYLPLLVCLLVILVGYTFAHWLLSIQLELISLNEDITDFVIPIVLGAIAIIFVVRPRLRILKLERKDGRSWDMVYYFLFAIGLIVPTVIAQEYIYTESGKLTELRTINEITEKPKTHYYKLGEYLIDKEYASVSTDYSVSGRNSEDFNMVMYITAPILKKDEWKNDWENFFNRQCDAWIGVKYRERISNRLDLEEKNRRFRQFQEKSAMDFQTSYPAISFFERVTDRHGDKELYDKAIADNKFYKSVHNIVLIPNEDAFESRSGNKLIWIVAISIVSLIIWLIIILLPVADQGKINLFKQNKPNPELV